MRLALSVHLLELGEANVLGGGEVEELIMLNEM